MRVLSRNDGTNKKEKYVVTLIRPEGVTVSEMQRYIQGRVENEDAIYLTAKILDGVSCTVLKQPKPTKG